MIATTTTPLTQDMLKVLDGIEMQGSINTGDETILAHIKHSIRLGYPQIRPQEIQPHRVCLVGGGPSLADTFDELRDLYFGGAKVVTVNGSYAWCLERNIRPSAHLVLDARRENARFIGPAVPQCRYFIASQCHPETWAALDGRDDVWIWHAMALDNPHADVLNTYYGGNWVPTPGGTTVVMRAISVLRMTGVLRFDLFGVDSCYLNGKGHAYPQPENEHDKVFSVRAYPNEHVDKARTFYCAPWMIKQLEDMLQHIRINGHDFKLSVHGDGLLAYALRAAADVQIEIGDAA